MNVHQARLAWHRKLGAETDQPCPSEREARAFDTGFEAGVRAAAQVADARRQAPGALLGSTWQEPVHRDGAFIAKKILELLT